MAQNSEAQIGEIFKIKSLFAKQIQQSLNVLVLYLILTGFFLSATLGIWVVVCIAIGWRFGLILLLSIPLIFALMADRRYRYLLKKFGI